MGIATNCGCCKVILTIQNYARNHEAVLGVICVNSGLRLGTMVTKMCDFGSLEMGETDL